MTSNDNKKINNENNNKYNKIANLISIKMNLINDKIEKINLSKTNEINENNKNIKILQNEVKSLTKQIENIKNNKSYENFNKNNQFDKSLGQNNIKFDFLTNDELKKIMADLNIPLSIYPPNNKLNEEKNKSKSGSSNTNSKILNFESSNILPLDFLFGKPKQKNLVMDSDNCHDSDDEDYDINKNIFVDLNIKECDINFEKLDIEPHSIKDLIDLGTKYENIIDINETDKNDDSNIENNESNYKKKRKIEKQKKKEINKLINDKNTFINKKKTDKKLKKIIKELQNEFKIYPQQSSQHTDEHVEHVENNQKSPERQNEQNNSNEQIKEENNGSDNVSNKCDIFKLNGKTYSINLKTIVKLLNPLKKLNSMIGITNVKNDIFDMIIYYLQGFEKNNKNMMHTVIEGPPGVGKTRLGKILAQIYCALGIIKTSKFKYIKATNLIGEHIGASRLMTQNVIDEADGGVLFIDEAYALSNGANKDPYAKECLDVLNFNLSENKKKLIIIIAGYPDHLDKYFFSVNPGLKRRFPFRFRIDSYNDNELKEIFIDKIRRIKWYINNNITNEYLINFFKKNKEQFTHFGGDIENFLKSCQIAHSRRTINQSINNRYILTIEDLDKGFEKFKLNRKNEDNKINYHHMYL